MRAKILIAVATAIVLAGCSSNASRMSPLPSAPSGQVAAQQLPPPPSYPQQSPGGMQQSTAPQGQDLPPPPGAEDGGQDFAALPSASSPAPSGPPTKESVLGQWSIAASGETCQIVVSLTGWQGGHRASTRGCQSPELKSIGAWNVEGNYVALKDNDGNTLGRLAQSGNGYQGRLDLAGAVSMTR